MVIRVSVIKRNLGDHVRAVILHLGAAFVIVQQLKLDVRSLIILTMIDHHHHHHHHHRHHYHHHHLRGR